MLELGENSAQLHYEVGAYAASQHIDQVIVLGKFASDIKRGFVENGGLASQINVCANKEKIVKILDESKPKTILIKGSRGMKMEQVIHKIVKSI